LPWGEAERLVEVHIRTDRLMLRGWREEDYEPFAAMNADPAVMRYFAAPLSAEETRLAMQRVEEQFALHGFGFWAAELKSSGEFAGFIGLGVPRFEAHFTPCVEIGWRLREKFWNRGLATEGARAVLEWAFETVGLREIVAFTAAGNLASRRVMEKIGMLRDPAEDFEHPSLPEGHALRPHVLYRARR